MPARLDAVIIRMMLRMAAFFPALVPALVLAISTLASATARAADLQPRSYAWLMSHASLVAAGTVTSVSGGLFGDGRRATLRVDGLIKGRWNRAEMEVAWKDKDFEETAYQRDAHVVVFAVMGKDSVFSQAAAGISCWPVERVDFNGKTARAVEYAYPLDLITQIPSSAIKTTEAVEKSMNFRVAKRKQWILVDNLLPPVRPLILAKPKPSRKPAAKHGLKPAKSGKSAPAK
jgi:hypothetical protein